MGELPRGLYEAVVTKALDADVRRAVGDGLAADRETLDPVEAPRVLAQYLETLIARALEAVPGARPPEVLEHQVRLCNAVIDLIHELVPKALSRKERIAASKDLLLAIYDYATDLGSTAAPRRPGVPLTSSALLVNARDEHRIGVELAHEIESADSIDLLCAFLKWSGYRVLRAALEEARRRGCLVRVLTTAYMGATEVRVLDALFGLGADVRVSYDTRRTRLHAKAWLFGRSSGFSTAYIGSSNMSHAALLDGLEWNVRISGVDAPDVMQKFEATFDSYWEDPEFERYDPSVDRERFLEAVRRERADTVSDLGVLASFDVRPYPFQQDILDRLEFERERKNRWANLVVAATGTGKTVIAALDYRRACSRWNALLPSMPGTNRTPLPPGERPSLLFVAHRKEILYQSRATFRTVLKDGTFGETMVAGSRPHDGRHVFASIQSLHRFDLERLAPDAYDVVIVDEFHHAEAPMYRKLLEHVRPKILLGLTATPERTDGVNVQDLWFDGKIAANLRLWDALDRGLLCPFQYFGIHDNTDLTRVQWRRTGGYAIGELERIYTGDDARVAIILEALNAHIANPATMRALGFCVSVAHARFMAAKFRDAGLKSVAISGQTASDERARALHELQTGSLQAVFTVDLLNEGVDLPAADTILFLRPTESATLFMQQLGRGLRHAAGKECLTVLDFVGHARKEFRFDLRLQALTGAARRALPQQVGADFPLLPSGCSLQLDRIAKEIVLGNLRRSLRHGLKALSADLQALSQGGQRDLGLGEFLEEAEIDVPDLYRSKGACWTRLRRMAGLPTRASGPREERLTSVLWRLQHWDDIERMDLYHDVLSGATAPPDERTQRSLAMLRAAVFGLEGDPVTPDAAIEELRRHPAVVSELLELLDVLRQRVDHISHRWDARPEIPLQIHCSYALGEILAGFHVSRRIREGVYYDKDTGCDLFFVTLHKSEKDYSPSTLYRDYAVSPVLFHWESQSTTGTASPTGRRYIRTRPADAPALLFVRNTRKEHGGRTAPYVFLGPATLVSHRGEKPIAITWRLDHAMPASLYRAARMAAS